MTFQELVKYRATWGSDTKQTLIDGGFDYSEMHGIYRNVSNSPYRRKEAPHLYKSSVTGNLYRYDEYTNHGWGGVKRGFKDLPANEYPYSIIYTNHPLSGD